MTVDEIIMVLSGLKESGMGDYQLCDEFVIANGFTLEPTSKRIFIDWKPRNGY